MSEAKPLNKLIYQFLQSVGIKNQIDEYSAIAHWDNSVGKEISKKTEPFKISKGILFVKVEDHVWRQELQFLKNEIMQKLNDNVGKKVVIDIKFF